MQKLVSFDLEIAKEIPTITVNRNGQDVEVPDDFGKHRPMGITCAATMVNGHEPMVYAANSKMAIGTIGEWKKYPSTFSPEMISSTVQRIVRDLRYYAKNGYKILTWNGLNFDFHTLAEESGMWAECADLALNHHVDLMFEVFCRKGWPVILKAALAGMGVDGKLEGMDGAKAPEVWKTDPLRVLRYVEQDVIAPLELVAEIQKREALNWQSGSGHEQFLMFPKGRLRTVKECLDLSEVNNSWMDNPMTRESFFAWMGEYSPFA